MKTRKILKLVKIIPASIMTLGVVTPIAAFTISYQTNSNLNSVAAIPLSSVIAANTNIGTFSVSTPSKASILQMAKTIATSFHNDNEDWFTITNMSVSGTVGTFTITPDNQLQPYYTNASVQWTFTYETTANHDLKAYFANATIYDLTRTTSSGNTAYFPVNSATPTKNDIIQALSGMHDAQSNPINLNQLQCASDPAWDASNDYYKVTITPKSDNNFYSNTTPSIEVHYNKQRTQLNTSYTNLTLAGYYKIPDGGFDSEQLAWALDNQNASPVTLTDNSQISWVNLITDTPAFQISGNETYTTKGATADTSNTQTPIVTNIQFVQKTALDTLVTGTSPSGATSGSQNNPYLAFSYNPILTDIRGAVDLGGSAGSALPNVQWDDIDIVINLTDKTATLTAKLTSLQYTGTVVLYYTTQN